MNSFQISVQFLIDPRDGYATEGGYANDPNDPGGETNYGISKRSYPDLDIKNLSLSNAISIYKRDYWDANSLDTVPLPLCIVMLDGYVNHGPRVMKPLIAAAKGNWKALIQERIKFYLRLIQRNPQMSIYKKGWLNRMNQLNKFCTIAEIYNET